MKAVRLHAYHSKPVVEEVPEPQVSGPLDVVVKVGGAGLCRLAGRFCTAYGPETDLRTQSDGPARHLFRCRGERGQFADVARVVLDDDSGLQVRRDFLEAVK